MEERKNINSIPIGIDLATTNCSVTYFDSSRSQPISVSGSSNASVPSHVEFKYFNKTKNFSITVGTTAKDSASEYSLYDSKRLIGKNYEEYNNMGDEKNYWTFGVEEDSENNLIKMVTTNPSTKQPEKFYPEEVSAIILKELMKQCKTRFTESPIGKVVVTIPVDFNVNQREATLRACKLAGLNDVTLIDEPTAAIIEYARNFPFEKETKALVIDFGGGTLDVCLCKVNGDRVEVLANEGDANFGGNNFDRIMYDLIIEKMRDEDIDDELINNFIITEEEKKTKIPSRKKNRLNKMRKIAEDAKKILSKEPQHIIDLGTEFGDDYFEKVVYIEQTEFAKKIKDKGLIDQFKNCVSKAIEGYENEIDLIIPIGGSSSIPIIKETVQKCYKAEFKSDDLFDKLMAVAYGAATYAHQLQNGEVMFKSLGYKSTLPFSIGMKVKKNDEEGYFYSFGKKGDELPLIIKKNCRRADNNEDLCFKIYYGEPDGDYVSEKMTKIKELEFTIGKDEKIDRMTLEFIMDKNGLITMKIIDRDSTKELFAQTHKLNFSKTSLDENKLLEHLKSVGFDC